MGKTTKNYEISRLRIDVKYTGKGGNEAKEEEKKIFFDFSKVFQTQLNKYANRVCVPTVDKVYGTNISLRPISINTVNQTIRSVEENSNFSVKKIEYYLPTNLVVITIIRVE